jgi:predicted transcriptional regulator
MIADVEEKNKIVKLSYDAACAQSTGRAAPARVCQASISIFQVPPPGCRKTTIPTTAATRLLAVPVNESVTDHHITCLECGGHFRSLKRHLVTHHAQIPEGYIEKWDLPVDYPMVAPDYANARLRLTEKLAL